MEFATVLLTGAAGRLGSAVREFLAPRCRELRLLDARPVGGLRPGEASFALDLQDRGGLREALRGCEAVVHFAGHPREAGWDVLLPANVVGAINLWETAVEQKVGRMVYASSNHAVGFHPRSSRLGERSHPLPDSRYGVTKVFMEALADMHAIKHGLRAFGMRIGHCSAAPTDARMLSHWLHPEDLAQLVGVGLRADYRNEIVYGVSRNARAWWTNDRAEELGYRPRHSADRYAPELESRREADPVAEFFQGGSFAADGFDDAAFPLR